MLSKLRRFDLVDSHERHAKLLDFGVALLDGDYPPVTHLFFHNADRKRKALPWKAVKKFDLSSCRITVADLSAGEPASTESLKKRVLLHDDILDALVIDLQNRRATRANDLELEKADGRLLLKAADASTRAFLRRLSHGFYSGKRSNALYDWKYIEFLRGDPQAVKSGAGYHLRITHLPPGEIARLTDPLPYLHAAELIVLLPDALAVETLEAMNPERQLQVFEELDEDQALRLLALMAPDIAADLVGRLQTNTTRSYLERLPKKQSERIIELLGYPEDTVGGIMTNDVVCVEATLTVAEARERLRERLKEPRFTYLIYIVGDEKTRRLRGLISLRNLVTAGDDEQRLEEIMDPYLTTLHPLDAANDSSYRLINSHLAAMPVVGKQGELLGIVTVDAAVRQVAPPSWRAQAPRVFS